MYIEQFNHNANLFYTALMGQYSKIHTAEQKRHVDALTNEQNKIALEFIIEIGVRLDDTKYKPQLVLTQMKYVSALHPAEDIEFYFYDDRYADDVQDYFTSNSNQIPANVTLKCVRCDYWHILSKGLTDVQSAKADQHVYFEFTGIKNPQQANAPVHAVTPPPLRPKLVVPTLGSARLEDSGSNNASQVKTAPSAPGITSRRKSLEVPRVDPYPSKAADSNIKSHEPTAHSAPNRTSQLNRFYIPRVSDPKKRKRDK
jgi:hypothetical protein